MTTNLQGTYHKNSNHTIQWETVQVLNQNITDLKQRKLQEAIQIKRLDPQLNRDKGFFIPNAYDQLIRLQADFNNVRA